MLRRLKTAWHAIESVHTAAWLLSLLPSGIFFWLGGRTSGVGWYWALVGAIVVFAAAVVLLDRYWPLPTRIPLSEAAEIAFRELDSTPWVMHAKGQKSPGERLDYMASFLTKEVPIWGRRPPAQPQLLSETDLRSGFIKGGASEIWSYGEDKPHFEELSILRSDLRRAIKSMKKQAE